MRLAVGDAVAHDDYEVCNQQGRGSYDLNCNDVHESLLLCRRLPAMCFSISWRAVYGLPATAIEHWRDAPRTHLGGLQCRRSAHTNVSKQLGFWARRPGTCPLDG